MGFNFCKANEVKCVIRDVMKQFYEIVLGADVITIHIYFCDVTSQAKAVMDRLYVFFIKKLDFIGG